MRVISLGGGVQSTAMVVLAVQGELDAEIALFANVGDDSEHPDTLDYVAEVLEPWAASQGFTIRQLRREFTRGDHVGQTLSILQYQALSKRSIVIPARMSNGAPGNRSCTVDWKIRVVGRWLREHGATPDNPAEVCIGFSTDEIQRVSGRQPSKYQISTYPLLDLGLNRADCMRVIADAGLPVPPKSACWFCPFTTPQRWAEMRRDTPDLFNAAQAVEDMLNTKRAHIGKDDVFLTRFGKRLSESIGEAQPALFTSDDGVCDDGYCFV